MASEVDRHLAGLRSMVERSRQLETAARDVQLAEHVRLAAAAGASADDIAAAAGLSVNWVRSALGLADDALRDRAGKPIWMFWTGDQGSRSGEREP